MKTASIVRWSLVLLGGTAACLSIDDRTIVDGPSGGAGAAGARAGNAGRAGQGTAGSDAGETGDAGDAGASLGGTGNGGSGTAGSTPGAGSGGMSAGAGGAPAGCGNGTMNPGETCDDGNEVGQDGCTNCAPDHGYTCTGTPSKCVTTCGDGVVGGAETCDDGAKAVGDGCSATCTLEASYGCWGEPSTCSRSCAGISATACQSESCCARTSVTGGTVKTGRGTETCTGCTAGCPVASCVDGDSGDDSPEHNATVNQFLLDKYETTVGRFRRFVNSYTGAPAAGAGAHPAIAGTGWQSAWPIAADAATLKTNINCTGTTWTTNAGANEQLPMNCVNWYEAFAFCAWDGGRLPTENEWEFAAAGGSDNRVFPWGGAVLDATRALYNCPAGCTNGFINLSPVGSKPAGADKFGNRDMVGSVREWVFDYYAKYSTNLCNNCATTMPQPSLAYRVLRGGGWRDTTAKTLRSADRFIAELFAPTLRNDSIGFRCARTP